MTSISERIIDCEQGTAEWFSARCGCVTASRVADAIAKFKKKKGEIAARRALRFELACELLTGNASESFVSEWMKRGTEMEPLARAEYEMRYNVEVGQIGFIYHPTIKRSGCSPDGVVGGGGLIEIKIPKPETHLQYLVADEIPGDYLLQMTWQLACYETQPWNDFVSYCPEMPEKYQLFRKRLERTAEVGALIRSMEVEVQTFNDELDQLLQRLKGLA